MFVLSLFSWPFNSVVAAFVGRESKCFVEVSLMFLARDWFREDLNFGVQLAATFGSCYRNWVRSLDFKEVAERSLSL